MKMSLIGMDSAIRHQSKKMQLPPARTRILHRVQQHRLGEELAILNHQLDAGAVHVNNAPGADVEMADFAVAHLAVWQTYIFAAGVNQRVGIFAQQAVIGGFVRHGDGVGLDFSAITPAVENDKNEWFRTSHKWLLAPGF